MRINEAHASPEVVTASCSEQSYTQWQAMDFRALDIWAVGCLLANVFTGKSWFEPNGDSVSQHQLHADWVSLVTLFYLCEMLLST